MTLKELAEARPGDKQTFCVVENAWVSCLYEEESGDDRFCEHKTTCDFVNMRIEESEQPVKTVREKRRKGAPWTGDTSKDKESNESPLPTD